MCNICLYIEWYYCITIYWNAIQVHYCDDAMQWWYLILLWWYIDDTSDTSDVSGDAVTDTWWPAWYSWWWCGYDLFYDASDILMKYTMQYQWYDTNSIASTLLKYNIILFCAMILSNVM